MTGADTGSRRILLLDFPLALMDRARRHRDALLREFAFIVNTENESSVPARLLEIARHSDEHYADLNPESELLCDEAIARGETSLDLELVVPPDFEFAVLSAVPVLLEVEEYCRRGDMLTLVPADDLRQFWAWYLMEFVRQMHGEPPIAWHAFVGANEPS